MRVRKRSSQVSLRASESKAETTLHTFQTCCSLTVAVLCWCCAGAVLVLCWCCAGAVLVLCWCCAGQVLDTAAATAATAAAMAVATAAIAAATASATVVATAAATAATAAAKLLLRLLLRLLQRQLQRLLLLLPANERRGSCLVFNRNAGSSSRNFYCKSTIDLVDYHQLGRLVSKSAFEREDPSSNPAADMVDAARNTAWDLGKQPNNYRSNYPTQEWARRPTISVAMAFISLTLLAEQKCLRVTSMQCFVLVSHEVQPCMHVDFITPRGYGVQPQSVALPAKSQWKVVKNPYDTRGRLATPRSVTSVLLCFFPSQLCFILKLRNGHTNLQNKQPQRHPPLLSPASCPPCPTPLFLRLGLSAPQKVGSPPPSAVQTTQISYLASPCTRMGRSLKLTKVDVKTLTSICRTDGHRAAAQETGISADEDAILLEFAPLPTTWCMWGRSRTVFLKVVRTASLGALRKCKEAVGGYALNGGVYYCIIYSNIIIRGQWKIK
ncbi:hypothetical protein FHG87_005151 [Trinorchestia longiramus]|nr:hypothetical protein FHG87_005151 [Trinorchestia longiramus]